MPRTCLPLALAAVLLAALAGAAQAQPSLPYRIVGAGQQSASPGPAPSYAVSADGLTVLDRNTGLTWQRSPDTDGDGRLTGRDKLTFAQAQALPAKLNAARFGGFSDWRLPGVKELYSLFDARGVDPSGPDMRGGSAQRPFLDTQAFAFAYGRGEDGERIIDAQYASATLYAGESAQGRGKLFGVNFADGRIKGYDLAAPRGEKTFYALLVRGNPAYGKNDFRDNGDGTVGDRATGLTWARADSGRGMDWQEALAWVRRMNAERHLGHADWRLPDIKELQSLVDYSRGPEATGTAAIDPLFSCTPITNEAGRPDFPYYWSSTTHTGLRGGLDAMYVAFGRALGWMGPPGEGRQGWGSAAEGPPGVQDLRPPPPGGPGGMGGMPPGRATQGQLRLVDVHGAGAQRSDPKAGRAEDFPRGRGPQGDVIRIRNYVRLVRGGG